MAIVYRHVRLDTNEVFYVGIGKTEKRAYVKSEQHRSKHWCNITNKTNYKVEILFEDLPWEDACKKEIELISLYGRSDLGLGTLVNLTDGGEGTLGKKLKPEHIDIIREVGKKNKGRVRSEEWKQDRRSKAVGVIHSEETKQIISLTHKGKPKSEEHRRKLREAATGRKHSPESIAKRLETRKINKLIK